MESETITLNACATCGAARKTSKRLPPGWKRRDDELFCPACWRKQYLLRAISIPVAAPLDGEWKDLRTTLRAMWGATTQASNWMITELFAQDIRRGNEPKMPPMPRIYLYPEARKRFPQLPARTVAALEQAVSAKYRKIRYKVIWTFQQSLPSFRYPIPFPVSNQGWRAAWDGERPIVSLRVGDARIRLRLSGGPRFHRQREAFGQIASGNAVQGELALYETGNDVMCKLVAWLPRKEPAGKPRSGTLLVRTDAHSLIVALNEKKDRLWVYNGDQIPRWIAEHRRQLQRWSEDQKAEHRPTAPFAQRRENAARRYHQRLDSVCHQVAALIAGYAERRRFASVRYDDKVQEFCPQFVWARLRSLLAEKLDAAGIELKMASGELTGETPEPLAEE